MTCDVITPLNTQRLQVWRDKVRARGDYYSIRDHVRQAMHGIDWDARRPCRAGDQIQIFRGRLETYDGRLPLKDLK